MNNTVMNGGISRFQTKFSNGPAKGQSCRMGYDVVTPGRIAEDIETVVNLTQSKVILTAKSNPRPPYDLEGLVDKFGYNKTKKDIVVELPFDFDKYDASSLKVSCHNGITRVFAVVKDHADGLELAYNDDGTAYWSIRQEDETFSVSALDLD